MKKGKSTVKKSKKKPVIIKPSSKKWTPYKRRDGANQNGHI